MTLKNYIYLIFPIALAMLFSCNLEQVGEETPIAEDFVVDIPRLKIPDRVLKQAPTIKLNAKKAREVRKKVLNWLECEDCIDKEKEQVVVLGDTVVLSLGYSLYQGPAPVRREAKRRHLVKSYAGLSKFLEERDERIAMDAETYLRTFLTNFIEIYQIRAAIALKEIDTDFANLLLSELPIESLSPSVQAAVNTILDQN